MNKRGKIKIRKNRPKVIEGVQRKSLSQLAGDALRQNGTKLKEKRVRTLRRGRDRKAAEKVENSH